MGGKLGAASFVSILAPEINDRMLDNLFQASSIAQKYNCALMRLDYQQEDKGLMSSLPLGLN